MPRIDPLQLLKCLGVLLTPDGGIRSRDEVQRLASLMMKFSKKLVSKCVYILILKKTQTDLLGLFMTAGGWTLVLTWLSDGISGKNWALVTELLELLLMCPVDVERLKSNSIPRLVKGLSKDELLGRVNVLATQLVDQWLKIVKDETVPPEVTSTVLIVKQEDIVDEEEVTTSPETHTPVDPSASEPSQIVISPQSFYKLTVRDGKQVIAKVDSVVNNSVSKVEQSDESVIDNMTVVSEETCATAPLTDNTEQLETKEKKEVKKNNSSRDKDRSRHKHKSSSSRSSSSSSNKDKHTSSKDKSRSKDREHRDHREKSKHRSNGSTKHNEKKEEKQAEKDKDTLAKIQPKTMEKMGRIPKKSEDKDKDRDKTKNDKDKDKKSEPRNKPSISIEVRKKDSGEKPRKTVKVFHSKLRSTGLEEAAKPPPPRASAPKKSPTVPTMPLKRTSPPREVPPPPEKRLKLPDTEVEKPGGIKLIPAKPKPAFLQESDMFMDALTASATNKKEPKKRKRRISNSKENTPTTASSTSPPSSPTITTSPLSSPLSMKTITAPKFYKDTLDTTEDVKPEPDQPTTPQQEEEESNEIRSPDAVQEVEEGPEENVVKEVNGLRGVLVYAKKRGPKKLVKWRAETELEEIRFFELDETERVNVTKTFMDMKQMEHTGEREALQMSRKLPNEDLMDERMPWKMLIPLDLKPPLAEPGKKSLEKDIQFAREKVILQALYFNRNMLPDSPAEPDPETHQMTDPVTIPLDDTTGNPDSVNDYQTTPWPESKGSPPHVSPMPGTPPIFGMPPFVPGAPGPPGFPVIPPQGFNNGPNFMPPQHMMGGGDWRPMPDSNMNGPPENMNHGPMNPMMYNNPADGGFMMNDYAPQGFGPHGPMPGPPGPGGPPGGLVGPPGGPPGAPMYQNFPNNNRGNNRGGFRNNMGRGGWFRPSGPPPNWHGNRGGGGHWGGRGGGGAICKNLKLHGFCRQRDTCPFMHPQQPGNAPY